MKVKAIIFDMDGVLIEAKEWHYMALNQALGLFGFGISRNDHEHRFDGLPTRTKLQSLSQETSLPTALHGFINRMKQHYTVELARQHLRPNNVHLHALKALRSEGYRLGVASNSIRATIDLMMAISGLQPHLDFILSNEDVRNPKPSPDIYLKAIALMRAAPEECLVLEDHPYGWQAATTAGAHLLKISAAGEVTYGNIRGAIDAIESAAKVAPAVSRPKAA
ncbi:MAG: HAD family phosphatase [Betaproteobacteria bacterium]|nr:HAD family phosphatase [Betaproteobacteria bacterium]NCA17623.1 HAD family phosphatase [Betaproteobacteria bacterium]